MPSLPLSPRHGSRRAHHWLALPSLLSLSCLLAAPLAAQIVEKVWIGTGTEFNTSGNWSPSGRPDANSHVLFTEGSISASASLSINFTSTPAGPRNVAAVSRLASDTASVTRTIRGNNNSGGVGAIVFHGLETTINGNDVTLLLANYSTAGLLTLGNGFASDTVYDTDMILATSGVVYAAEGATVRINTAIHEQGGSQSITKLGEGILQLGGTGSASSTPNRAALSTYTGGVILAEGIIEWALSGGRDASPFGSSSGGSTLTLQGGTLRSTSDSGRTVSVPVILDGGATIGGDTGKHGSITFNSYSGSVSATIISDSTLTIHNQTTSWNQSITGSGNLIKDGDGTLTLTAFANSTFTGDFTVAEGTVRLTGSLANSPLIVQNGARVEGAGTAAAGLTAQEGATVRPGLAATRGNLTTGALDLQAGSTLEVAVDSSALDGYDRITATGPVSIDGANLSITLSYSPEIGDAWVLIDNQSGAPLVGLVSIGGTTLNQGDQFSLDFDDTAWLFQIDYTYAQGPFANSLAVIAIPEPATYAALLGLGALLAIRFNRRRK